MITEALMSLGRFDLHLTPDAPNRIRDAVALGVNLHVTSSHVNDPTLDQTTLKQFAMYSGIIRKINKQEGTFSGCNLLGYLQTNRGHATSGTTHTSLPATYPTTFALLMASWFSGTRSNNLTAGTNAGTSGTSIAARDVTAYLPPFKPQLDDVARQTGNEYRCNPDGTVDYGTDQTLFVLTPTVIISPQLVGSDNGYRALNVTQWSVEQSIENYRNYGHARTSDSASTSIQAAPTSTFTMEAWNTPTTAKYTTNGFISSDSTNATDTAYAAQRLGQEFEGIEYDFGCAVDEFCIPTMLTPGDWVYVYDPANDIHGTNYTARFRGTTMFPEKLRCTGYTWPVQAGMGVYVGGYTPGITDITDYVVWEAGSTRLDIGTVPRPFIPNTISKYKS